MAIATLSIDIEAKLARLENDLGRATRLIEKQAGRMDRSFANAGESLTKMVAGLGAGAGITWLVDFGRRTVDGIDKLNDLSDATGSSVENLSALEDVARRTGGSFDTVSTSLVKFNKELTDAKPGSEVAAIFERLGLSVEELRRLDPAQALLKTAQAFSEMTDGGERARLTQTLFGRSVQDVAPFLKDLADKGELVATVTTKQAQEAEKFNKQMAELSTNVSNAARSLVSDLLPALNKLFDDQRTGGFLKVLGLDGAGPKIEQVSRLLEGIGLAKRALELKDAISTNPDNVEQLKAQLAEVEAEGRRLGAAFKAANTEFQNLTSKAGAGRGFVNPALVRPDPTPPTIADSSAGKLSAVDQYIQRLEAANLAALDLSAAEALTIDIALGKLPGLTEGARAYLQSLADGLDALKLKSAALNTPLESFRSSELAAAEGVNAALSTDQLARYNDARERLNRLLDATPSAALQQQQQDLQALGDALKREAITIDQYYEAVGTRLGTIPAQLEDSTRLAENFGDAMADSATRALTSFGDLGDVFDSLAKQLANLAIQQALFNPLKSMFTSGGSGLLSLLGFAKGGAFDGSGPMRFATGSVFDSPTLFKFAAGGAMNNGVLGEAGPEAILPLKRGAGGKLGVVAQGGGGVVINQYNTFGAGVDRNQLAAALEQNKRATIAAVADARRRGRETA